ncbi:hypothetical protein T440DRAFT_76402 [Plenodomus tracheiphilus IPT5]|uniref:Uncharacterized protein n=1 Tax=Plenodomus tracheiphilus IPT5 TaxID=1408161 RepID=A0A6A7B625_9PLEO|nr:hypothetical protein T440DRAFT_76402 [Plenodomus tracheiphilus IPT5]
MYFRPLARGEPLLGYIVVCALSRVLSILSSRYLATTPHRKHHALIPLNTQFKHIRLQNAQQEEQTFVHPHTITLRSCVQRINSFSNGQVATVPLSEHGTLNAHMSQLHQPATFA